MKTMKRIRPTENYSIEIPGDAHEEYDAQVSSYWINEGEAILQISSYSRVEGEQTSAMERLDKRLKQENLLNVKPENISIPSCNDVAIVHGTDSKGIIWIFCYAVWPDLTILATISAPSDDKIEWALTSIKSLKH